MSTARLTILTMAALLTGACSGGDDTTERKQHTGTAIRLTVSMQDDDTQTRAQANLQSATLMQPATAGVYVYMNGMTSKQSPSGYGYENITVTGMTGSQIATQPMYYPQQGSIDVYVYAPRPAGEASLTAMPVTVAADQTGTDGYVASDFIFGHTLAVPYTNGATPINVALGHALSKLILNITPGNGTPSLSQTSVKSVTLGDATHQVMTSTTVNLTDGSTATAHNAVSTVTLVKTVESATTGFTTGNAVQTACVLPPQTLTACPVAMTIDGQTYTAQLSSPAGGFVGGKAYSYNVTVDLQGIGITVGSITAWNSGITVSDGIDAY